MNQNLLPIIQANELLATYKTENIVLIDATNGKDALTNYQNKHLKGALYVDMNTQLANIKDDLSLGGRHPLPAIEKFAVTLKVLGISEKSHVVIYDENNGSNAAARFWWMLKSIGHQKVQVLNGGLKEAEKNGFPISNEVEKAGKTELYKVEKWMLPLSDIFEVEQVSESESYTVIDVRDEVRFKGISEPVDLIAGHIPGAINIPFTSNLDDNGLFLPAAELKIKYQILFTEKPAENIIVHCGSGVTACHTLLALAYAGFEIPKLYTGSWSEWSRNNRPIVTDI